MAETTTRRHSRLLPRCLSGAAFLAGAAVAVWLAPAAVGWLFLVMLTALAQFEFYDLLRRQGINVYPYIGVGVGAAYMTAVLVAAVPLDPTRGPMWEHAVLAAGMLYIFVRQFFPNETDRPVISVAFTLLGVLYVPYLLSFITRLAFAGTAMPALHEPLSPVGRRAVLYLVIVVKSADMGAFFVGSAFGRRPLAPRLSPNKTWEGLVGGGGAAAAVSVGFVALCGGWLGGRNVSLPHAAAMGLGLALAGTAGDIFESLVKRAAGAKDAGTAIPGMGGLLDVLDSLLFGAPVLYLYLTLGWL